MSLYKRFIPNPRSGTHQAHGLLIRSDQKWKEFKYYFSVPAEVLQDDFDWVRDPKNGRYLKHHGGWHELSQFEGGAPPGWDGIIHTSGTTGILIKLDGSGEQYKIGTYRVAPP